MQRDPFAGMTMKQQVEPVTGDEVKPRERVFELGFGRVGPVRAIARDEPESVAMPFAVDGNRVIEFGRRDRRQIARQRTSAISRSHAVLISDFVAGVARPPAYPTARAICGSIVEGQMVSLV